LSFQRNVPLHLKNETWKVCVLFVSLTNIMQNRYDQSCNVQWRGTVLSLAKITTVLRRDETSWGTIYHGNGWYETWDASDRHHFIETLSPGCKMSNNPWIVIRQRNSLLQIWQTKIMGQGSRNQDIIYF